MRGSLEWASASDELVRGDAVTLSAFCGTRAFYTANNPSLEWTVPGVSEMIWGATGNCDGAAEFELSGQPGLLCGYEHDGRDFMQAMTVIGDVYLQVQAMFVEPTDEVRSEVLQMLESAAVTVS
jgi:hypothetical protein